MSINNTMDILTRIESYLSEVNISGEYNFLEKEKALRIMEIIANDAPEDTLLLGVIRGQMIDEWKINNTQLIESFYKILKFYGIIENGDVVRKTIIETRGKTKVRKFVTLDNKKEILSILKGNKFGKE